MAALSDQILRIEQKIGKLVEAVENDTLPGAIVQGRMAEHQQALPAVISRRSDLESELNLCTDTVVPTAQIHEALSRFHGVLEAAEPDLQKQLLAALIDRITVTKERVLDQVLLAFDPLSLLCKLDTDSSTASNVTFTYDTVHPG